MGSSKRPLSRRAFVKSGASLTAGSLLSSGQGSEASSKDNPIVQENRKPGTLEWQLQCHRFDDPVTLASYPLNRRLRSSVIEGYASRTSVLPGEEIEFKVSLQPEGGFWIDFYRLGYYGGTGGRHMGRLGPFSGGPQPVPLMSLERLRECRWETGARLKIPQDWPSGVYLGKLTRDEPFGAQSYVIFVVKEHRPCEALFQVADLTWQAYNKWPGNDSLYDDGTPQVWYTGPHVRVSFDRPYAKYCQVLDAPATVGSGSFLLWEFPLAFWLEQQGYDVTYCANLDLHLDPAILRQPRVFLSVGHDEYWSGKMFQEALQARDEGLSFAFFSGNAVYHEILLYDSSVTGEPARAFARKRLFEEERELLGSTSYGSGYGDWIVTRPQHWIYEGTGLAAGDRIPAIIGWEYHGPPLADHEGLEVVAEGDLTPSPAELKRHAAVVYPCPKGNWVFNAGTIWWAEGLSQPPGHIPARVGNRAGTFGVLPAVQKITSNVLDRMIRESPRK